MKKTRKTSEATAVVRSVSPWYCLDTDFIGPVSLISEENRSIFTVSDYYTNFAEAIPALDKCASWVASMLFKDRSNYSSYKNKFMNQVVYEIWHPSDI